MQQRAGSSHVLVDLVGLLASSCEFLYITVRMTIPNSVHSYLEAVKGRIREISACRIGGVVGGSSDIRVLGEIDIKLFAEESKPLQKLHCSGCLEVVSHLYESVVRLVVEDLNADDISIVGKEIKEYITVHFLLVQIGNEKHAVELGTDEAHRKG